MFTFFVPASDTFFAVGMNPAHINQFLLDPRSCVKCSAVDASSSHRTGLVSSKEDGSNMVDPYFEMCNDLCLEKQEGLRHKW